MINSQKQAFTLVELIVVITILAILGTIAFISLQGYSKVARNSARISDMKNVEIVLELYMLKNNKYPMPDNATGSIASGEILYYTGNFGTSVQQIVQKISTIPTDPKDGTTLMEYSITQDGKEYGIKYTMETAKNSIMNSAYAENTQPMVRGTYNGLYVLGQNGNYYAVPSLFTNITNLDTQASYSVGSQEILFTAVPLNITKANFKGNLKTFGDNLKTAYSTATELNTEGVYAVLANTTDTEFFMKTISAVDISENTGPINGCITEPLYANASFTVGSVASIDQVWQNTNNTNPCYYECINGYTGNDCSIPPITGWMALDPNCDIADIEIRDESNNLIQTWAGCNSTLGTGVEYTIEAYCYNYTDGNLGTGGDCGAGNYGDSNDKESDYYDVKGANNNIPPDIGVNNIWGKLYRWENASNACISGYHLPTDGEWDTLETTLNGGTICRSADGWACDGLGWKNRTLNGKISSNNIIEALQIPLAGRRNTDSSTFYYRGSELYLWSNTSSGSNAYARHMYWNFPTVHRGVWSKVYGFSVRCIKN